MPESRLKSMPPLGRDGAGITVVGSLTIREVVDVALAAFVPFQGCSEEAERIAGRVGLPLAGPGRAVPGKPWGTIWTAPARWLVETPFEHGDDIVARLEADFVDTAAIIEQTDAWVRFDLSGPRLCDVLERICLLDVRSMEPGDAGPTLVDHLRCHVVRRAPDVVSMLGPRSAAGSLHHSILTAASSVELLSGI